MARGRWGRLILVAALVAATGSAAASPLGYPGADLLPSAAPAKAPLQAKWLPPVAAPPALPSAGPGPDLLATLAGALGALGSALGGVAGALGTLGSALLEGFLALASALAQALAWLASAVGAALGVLASGLAWLLGLLARGAGDAGRAVARDPRLLAPAGAAASAGALAWLWKLGKLAPVGAFFSRLQDHELLRHDARQRIFAFIKERPGAHLSEIAGHAGLGWGATVHHLTKLRGGQLVTAKRVGNHLCHFVNGDGHTAEQQRFLGATKAPKAQAIVQYLQLRGPSTQARIAEELGMSGALVSWHAKRLEEMGVLTRVRVGRASRLVLAPPAAGLSLAPPRAPAHPAPAKGPMPAAA
jgi:DNA-binding MarR family transcriptional regulator